MQVTFLLLCLIPLSWASDDWIHQQNRQFVEDRIQYWGTGFHLQEDIAIFKAKGMAIKSIGEECGGFYSKDIVIRRQKIFKEATGSRVFVHADIPYVSCNYSKTPMAKENKDLENPKFVEAQKLYDSLLLNQYNNKPTQDVIEHIKKLTRQNDQKINAIDKRLTDLEARPAGAINQTVIQHNYQMTASESSYKECMDEYYELMEDARRESLDNPGMHKGNLAYGKARDMYNKAMRKEWKCNEYRE